MDWKGTNGFYKKGKFLIQKFEAHENAYGNRAVWFLFYADGFCNTFATLKAAKEAAERMEKNEN